MGIGKGSGAGRPKGSKNKDSAIKTPSEPHIFGSSSSRTRSITAARASTEQLYKDGRINCERVYVRGNTDSKTPLADVHKFLEEIERNIRDTIVRVVIRVEETD